MSLNRKIKQAKLKMFTKELNFFGIQSYRFNWKFVDPGNEYAFGWVVFDRKSGQLESGSIQFNKQVFEKPEFDYSAIVYTAVHELLHILNMHGSRANTRKHDIWCVACDHVVEREMKEMKAFLKSPLPKYHIIDELNDELPKCTTEQAYSWLFNHKTFPDRIKQ